MHPILFESGSFTLYTYGVLLAAAYLLGLQFALVRARARGLDRQRVMDLGIWIIVGALAGAKLLLLVTDFRQYTQNPRALLDLVRSAISASGAAQHPLRGAPPSLEDLEHAKATAKARKSTSASTPPRRAATA